MISRPWGFVGSCLTHSLWRPRAGGHSWIVHGICDFQAIHGDEVAGQGGPCRLPVVLYIGIQGRLQHVHHVHLSRDHLQWGQKGQEAVSLHLGSSLNESLWFLSTYLKKKLQLSRTSTFWIYPPPTSHPHIHMKPHWHVTKIAKTNTMFSYEGSN